MPRPSRNRHNSPSCFSRTATRRLRCEPLEDRRMLSVLFVDDDAASGGDGLAWGTAYQDLQHALSDAATLNADGDSGNDVDRIWIAEGTYKPSEPLEPGNFRSVSFSLVDGVTLYGGFLGTETTLEERDASAHETVLSGDIGTVGDAADNAYTVVYCGGSVAAGLDGVTVSGGNANGAEDGAHLERRDGGGIYAAGTLTLSGSTVSNNAAAGSGAGLAFRSGNTLAIQQTTFDGNTSESAGGGIAAWGNVSLLECELTNNVAANGGAVYCNGTLSADSSVFSSNSASQYAGGAADIHGEATFVNCEILDNTANTVAGGIGKGSGALTLLGSTVSGNSSTGDGGGIAVFAQVPVTISDSVFSDNVSGVSGGGIAYHGQDCLLSVQETTFDGNTAEGSGGGIAAWGDVSLLECDMQDNVAAAGGAVFCEGTFAAETSVFSNNSTNRYSGGAAELHGEATVVDCQILGIPPRNWVAGFTNGTGRSPLRGRHSQTTTRELTAEQLLPTDLIPRCLSSKQHLTATRPRRPAEGSRRGGAPCCLPNAKCRITLLTYKVAQCSATVPSRQTRLSFQAILVGNMAVERQNSMGIPHWPIVTFLAILRNRLEALSTWAPEHLRLRVRRSRRIRQHLAVAESPHGVLCR